VRKRKAKASFACFVLLGMGNKRNCEQTGKKAVMSDTLWFEKEDFNKDLGTC
jgi:hypothetical protein